MTEEQRTTRFHIGMRNVKTGLSIFLCLLVYRLLNRDSYFLACVSAIICLQDSVEKTVTSGLNRMIGTCVGAAMGVALLYVDRALPALGVSLFTAALGCMLLIACLNAVKRPDAIVIGCVVLLAILLEQTGQPPLEYGVNRLLDTFVGIFIAVVVNRFVLNPDQRGKKKDQPPEEPPAAAIPDKTENNIEEETT